MTRPTYPAPRRRVLQALALAALLALLAACGGGAAPPATATSATSGTAASSTTSGSASASSSAAASSSPSTSGSASGAAAPTAPVKVTLALDWFPNTDHTGIYVAQSKGWYRDEGLDLNIIPPSDPSAALKLVAAGQTELGVGYQSQTTFARAQGIPIVSVAALLQHSLGAYMSKKAKNLTRPRDFEGKKYGSSGLSQAMPTLATAMKCDGADVGKVEVINVGQKLMPALLGDQVDFISGFPTWEGIEAELKGNPLNVVDYRQWCVPDNYALVIIAGETTLQQKPQVVRRFLAATQKGFEFAMQNPAEAGDLLIKAAPDLDKELVRRSQEELNKRYVADAPRWGVQSADQWKKYADWLLENKLIDKPVDTSKAFTNDFLPK